jgi:hypothetical protein
VESNRALVFEDAEALNPEPLDLDWDHPGGSVRTAVLKAVVASAAAHHICCSDFVDRAVAIADVVEGGVVAEGLRVSTLFMRFRWLWWRRWSLVRRSRRGGCAWCAMY